MRMHARAPLVTKDQLRQHAAEADYDPASRRYVEGLIDPVERGIGVRLPSDGLLPTSTATSITRFPLTFPAPVATKVTGGLIVLPCVKYQYIELNSHTTWDSGFSWGAMQPGAGYSAMAANAAWYRGACNMNVSFTFKGAAIKRGGRMVATMLPPGLADGVGGYPTNSDSAYNSSRTVFIDLAKCSERLDFSWYPAVGEAVTFYSNANVSRSASTWTSIVSTSPATGDASWLFYFQTDDTTGVSIDVDVEITTNTEFIPGFGGAQQLFPGRVVDGSAADVARALKPVERAMTTPSVITMMSERGPAVDSVGIKGGERKASDDPILSAYREEGIKNLTKFVPQLSPYEKIIRSAVNRAMDGRTRMMFKGGSAPLPNFSKLWETRHRVAMALEIPELSPLTNYGDAKPEELLGLKVPRPAEMTDEEWENRLVRALASRRPAQPFAAASAAARTGWTKI